MNQAELEQRLTLPTEKIKAWREGAVAHIVFNNPERHNAVSLEMWDAVELALRQFAEDSDVRVLVLSGAGGKAFVSGADISKFEQERGSHGAVTHYNTRTKAVYDSIEHFPKPTIAMINGHCIGGGLNLAACSDVRVCTGKSKFAMPAARLALGYPFDAIRRLISLVGPGDAKRMMFTAKSIDAATALRIGFVQEIADEDQLHETVNSLAADIAGNAPLTVKAMKFIACQVLEPDPAKRDLETGVNLVADCFASEDYMEGRKAFMEKRKPQFKGA